MSSYAAEIPLVSDEVDREGGGRNDEQDQRQVANRPWVTGRREHTYIDERSPGTDLALFLYGALFGTDEGGANLCP